jgi:hypothetical protein
VVIARDRPGEEDGFDGRVLGQALRFLVCDSPMGQSVASGVLRRRFRFLFLQHELRVELHDVVNGVTDVGP